MQYFIDLVIVGLSIGMIYALVAIGISLIFSGLDIVHFAHGEIYMFGAFIGLMLFKHLGIGYVPTLLLAIVLTGLFGVFLERACRAHVVGRSTGFPTSMPTRAIRELRNSQMMTPIHVEHTWNYLNRKLDFVLATQAGGGQVLYR